MRWTADLPPFIETALKDIPTTFPGTIVATVCVDIIAVGEMQQQKEKRRSITVRDETDKGTSTNITLWHQRADNVDMVEGTAWCFSHVEFTRVHNRVENGVRQPYQAERSASLWWNGCADILD